MTMWFWYGSAQAALAFVFFGVALLVVVGVALWSDETRRRHSTGRPSTGHRVAARAHTVTRTAA
jgi:hypothetical protein